jgi:hypothetical protein
MKNRILVFSLVIILAFTASNIQAAPVQADPASIESIYFTSAELDELRTLTTAPSHSTIWNNIVTWADAHKDDAPVEQMIGNSYDSVANAHAVRRHIEAMGFMYAMTEDTTYADSAINWMLAVSAWGGWGNESAYYFDDAAMLRGFSFGYSVFHDYMSPGQRQTILDAMVLHTNLVLDHLISMNPPHNAYPNHWGFLAACVGLSAIAIGPDHPDSGTWLDNAVTYTQLLLSIGGNDGGFFEGPSYTMNLFSHVIPFLDALKRNGTNLFDNGFLRNHAYYHIYLSYNDTFMCMEDSEPLVAYCPWTRGVNALDFIARLAKEYNNGYAQEFADLYADQSVMQSYIWKSPSLTPLPLDGLPKTRLFEGIGYVVLKSGWSDNDLNVIFKSGVSWGHANPSQNEFAIYNQGEKVTGPPGVTTGSDEGDTWSHNCLLVNGLGQAKHLDSTPWGEGVMGDILALDIADPYYRYTLGDATALYDGSTYWPYTAGVLNKWLRHFVFVENPNFIVIYDDIEAPEPSRFDWLMNGTTLSVAGSTITVNGGEPNTLNTVIVEPSDFLYEIDHYYRDAGWFVHDYDWIKVRPPVESTDAEFLTVHYLMDGGATLPAEKVSVGNVIGVRVPDGDYLYLILFSNDGNPVSEYIELDGYYQSADGNPYTFNGTQVLAEYDTYQVMRLQKPRPPVLVLIGDKSINEGEPLEFTILATDPNDDPITYSANLTSLPEGMSFDPATRTFSWTPGSGEAGTYSDVHFEVSDGDFTDSEDITIIVNGPPVLNTIGNKSINEGNLLEFTISATDPNDDSLTYSADLTSLPAGASFDPATRTFSWTPGFDHAGTYSGVHFEVSDGELIDSDDIIIKVGNYFTSLIIRVSVITLIVITMVSLILIRRRRMLRPSDQKHDKS